MPTMTLNHNRGWASVEAAKSIHRIDKALGHPLQITEAGRSPEQADANYEAYQRYLRGEGPWAPLAYNALNSVHCWGGAIDSDEAQQHLALMEEHGWIRTVYRNGVLIEPWHFEYDKTRDQHYNDPEEDEMTPEQARMLEEIHQALFKDGEGQKNWSALHKIDHTNRMISTNVVDSPGGPQAKWSLMHSVSWLMRTMTDVLGRVKKIEKGK